jgi:hypothetical protein
MTLMTRRAMLGAAMASLDLAMPAIARGQTATRLSATARLH